MLCKCNVRKNSDTRTYSSKENHKYTTHQEPFYRTLEKKLILSCAQKRKCNKNRQSVSVSVLPHMQQQISLRERVSQGKVLEEKPFDRLLNALNLGLQLRVSVDGDGTRDHRTGHSTRTTQS